MIDLFLMFNESSLKKSILIFLSFINLKKCDDLTLILICKFHRSEDAKHERGTTKVAKAGCIFFSW